VTSFSDLETTPVQACRLVVVGAVMLLFAPLRVDDIAVRGQAKTATVPASAIRFRDRRFLGLVPAFGLLPEVATDLISDRTPNGHGHVLVPASHA
jgi:hypothetical protein